jgi:hypothetical protein
MDFGETIEQNDNITQTWTHPAIRFDDLFVFTLETLAIENWLKMEHTVSKKADRVVAAMYSLTSADLIGDVREGSPEECVVVWFPEVLFIAAGQQSSLESKVQFSYDATGRKWTPVSGIRTPRRSDCI